MKLLLLLLLVGCGSGSSFPYDARFPTETETQVFVELANCIGVMGDPPLIATPDGVECGRGPSDECVQYGGLTARGIYVWEYRTALWADSQPEDRALRVYRHESAHSLTGDTYHCNYDVWCGCVGECGERQCGDQDG